MPAELQSTSQGQTLILTLSNPERRNAIDPAMYAAGIEALSVAESSPDIRSVIITGAGGMFCSGGNLQRLLANRQQAPEVQAQSIEGLHKLLKAAGWELEGWLQRDGRKIFRKLLLALAACASIWELMRRTDAQAEEFRRLLMALGGRQAKRKKPVTAPGLLAGLWVLQASLGPLARHGPDRLQAMLEANLPLFAGP